ncbi:MAG: PA14 domain-containing protein [Bacteroidota bacterium]
MAFFNKHHISLLLLLMSATPLLAQQEPFSSPLETQQKPWTDKPFYNDPNNFQFVIVSDRTGGHRKGVFGDAVAKINQLYPEFVLSVGDLIEGYTKDQALMDEQWAEFQTILDPLAFRFFYVAGNHDYSNKTMGEQWDKRFGANYYHFIYKDVLFLVFNTNDGDGVLLGDKQISDMQKVIADHPDVRWTMLFMHHPLWAFKEVNGFDKIEAALAGRKYTAYAGHTHRYLYEVKNDQNHYVLATTGGGSRLRGPKFGEFDHVSWVTMTDDGPKMVNLKLSGIVPHDISTRKDHEMGKVLIQNTDFRPLVLKKEAQRKVVLHLRNPSEKPISFRARLYHHHHMIPDSVTFQKLIGPKSEEKLVIRTVPASTSIDPKDWDPLELEWEIRYITVEKGQTDFLLQGREAIDLKPSVGDLSLTPERIFLDTHRVQLQNPYHGYRPKYTVDRTRPGIESMDVADGIALKESKTVQVVLFDNEGFHSDMLTKSYKKVKPKSGIRVKQPKPGIEYTYYEGNFSQLPDFDMLKSIKKGVVTQLDPDLIGQRLDHYAIRYEGYFSVPKAGVYTFHLRSDDGSRLFVGNKLVVDNGGSHSALTKTGMVALKKGMHAIKIEYFEDFLGEELRLWYSSPDMPRTSVSFFH